MHNDNFDVKKLNWIICCSHTIFMFSEFTNSQPLAWENFLLVPAFPRLFTEGELSRKQTNAREKESSYSSPAKCPAGGYFAWDGNCSGTLDTAEKGWLHWAPAPPTSLVHRPSFSSTSRFSLPILLLALWCHCPRRLFHPPPSLQPSPSSPRPRYWSLYSHFPNIKERIIFSIVEIQKSAKNSKLL